MAAKKPLVRARDVMNPEIQYIDGMANVVEAAEIMRKEKVTSLVVEKRTPDDAWGLVVAHDMVAGVVIAGKRPQNVHVYEIMTKPIITVPADMDIRYVAKLMNQTGIRRTPVEEGGKLIGIVTQSDLIMKGNLFSN